MTTFECNVCYDDEKPISEKIECSCKFITCKDCAKRYIMEQIDEAHCMNCKTRWSLKDIVNYFGKPWAEGTREGGWRHRRKNVALEREKARLPETLALLPAIRERERIEKEKKEVLRNLEAIRFEIRQRIQMIRVQLKPPPIVPRPYTRRMDTFPKKCGFSKETALICLSYRKCILPEGVYVRTTSAKERLFRPNRMHASWHRNGIYCGPARHQAGIDWMANKSVPPRRAQNTSVELEDALNELKQIDQLITETHGQKQEEPKEIKVTFVCPCPDDECKGMIDSRKFACVRCDKKICKSCREPKSGEKDEKHKCDPEIVKNVKFLRQDTKPCPKCATAIHKLSGCFDPETPILTWDGETVLAKDVCVGMKLIGDDGTPRFVEELVAGKDVMYEIVQNKADNYIVNSQHKLSLKMGQHKTIVNNKSIGKWKAAWFEPDTMSFKTKNFSNVDEATEFLQTITTSNMIDITVSDYIGLTKRTKTNMFGYRSEGVHWEAQPTLIDPYILGFWLGDGYSNGESFACADHTIIEHLVTWAKTIDAEITHQAPYRFSIRRAGTGKRIALGFKGCSNGCVGCSKKLAESCKLLDGVCEEEACFSGIRTNPWKDLLKQHNLINNKHIPQQYITNDTTTRLSLLAGLIDSDGHIANNGKRIVIVQTGQQLSEQIAYLAKSLGFCVSIALRQKKNVKCPGAERKDYKDQYVINISGNISSIPTLLERKKCKDSEPNKDMLRTKITVNKLNKGRYVGWRVSGPNKRFLLGDFTVSHNCDQMWCSQCRTAFSWRSGTIATGMIHNPHAIEWERQHGNTARDIADIPCGGLVHMNMIRTGAVNHKRVEPVHRIIAEIDRMIRRPNDDFDQLRMNYVTDKIDEDKWKQSIFLQERKNARIRANADILTTLRTLGVERFRNLVESLNTSTQHAKIIKEFMAEMEEIRLFINKAFRDELPVLGTKCPTQVRGDWTWGHFDTVLYKEVAKPKRICALIKTMDGRTHGFGAKSTTTIGALLSMAMNGGSTEGVCLSFRGRNLSNKHTYADYDIDSYDDTTLHVTSTK